MISRVKGLFSCLKNLNIKFLSEKLWPEADNKSCPSAKMYHLWNIDIMWPQYLTYILKGIINMSKLAQLMYSEFELKCDIWKL